MILSRTETHDPDASLMCSSSEQQGTPQVVTPITKLSRDSGVGTMSSVWSGRWVPPQSTTSRQNGSVTLAPPRERSTELDRGRKRQRDMTSRQEQEKKRRRYRENSSSSSDSSVEEVRRKRGSGKDKSYQRRSLREGSVLSGFREEDEESDSDESDEDEIESVDSNFKPGVKTPQASRFLPTFMGQGEKWEVWFARFEDVATSHNWTKAEKLSVLIPLLRKNAGEFVFGSVNKKVQTNYKKLVQELHMQFRTVESERGYRLKWTELKQTPGHTVEELACTYKMACMTKHIQIEIGKTRREDLVSKFFKALSDSTAKAHVQFVKGPTKY